MSTKDDVTEKLGDSIEFTVEDLGGSASVPVKSVEHRVIESDEKVEIAGPDLSPIDKELALPELPKLNDENRARLQMQSPTRLHFYWSVRSNPFRTLNKAFGNEIGSYTLVLKMVDRKRNAEEFHPIEAEGSWWFNVNADTEYQAEIGFYAPSRPFVRIMYSNTIQTPRKSPSARSAVATEWRVPSQKFALVLDVAGFKQDAFEVAITGDNLSATSDSTNRAFAKFTMRPFSDFAGLDGQELRYSMLSLASGVSLEQIHFRISPKLFEILQSLVGVDAKDGALAALKSEFEIAEDDLLDEEIEFGPEVYGNSLVHFPKRSHRLRTRPRGFDRVAKFEPLSSPGVWQ